jgi:8-oxo-dGTP pyrophosphatase MutT (NUDIX family)
MKLKNSDPHLHYVAVTAIIHQNGKYLITKRSAKEKAFSNMWTVPGGRISVKDYANLPKTTPIAWYNAVENTLKKEIKEEVNLEIDNIRYLIDMTFIRPDKIPVVVLSFYADYKSGKVKLDDDAVDFAWVTAREAEKYNLIEGIYEEIVMADKLIRTSHKREPCFSPKLEIKGADPKRVKFKPRKY